MKKEYRVFFGSYFEFRGQLVRSLEMRILGGLGSQKSQIQWLAECNKVISKCFLVPDLSPADCKIQNASQGKHTSHIDLL